MKTPLFNSMLAASVALITAANANAAGCAIGVGGGSSSANFGVDVDVVGAGGGDSSSPNFAVQSTVGQVIKSVESSSPGYSDGAGMWDVLVTIEGEDPVYDPVGCQGEVQIASLVDYQAYVEDDYGRGGGNRYKHVRVVSSLADQNLALLSPCRIVVEPGLTLQGDIVLVDARRRVRFGNHATINGGEVCVESAERSVVFGRGATISADELTVQSRQKTRLGRTLDADVAGAVRIGSSHGEVEVDDDLTIHAGEVQLSALRALIVGDDAYVESQGDIELASSSDVHWTLLGARASLTANHISLSAAGLTVVGDDANLDAADSISVESTGAGPLGLAAVQHGATMSAGTDTRIAGARRLYIGPHATVLTTGNLDVDALGSFWLYCLISPIADFSYANVSGNCAPFVP